MNKIFVFLFCLFGALSAQAQCVISGASAICTGTTTTLTTTGCTGSYTWSSSDASIATVDASGIVTGIAAGYVTISYSDGSPSGTSTFALTVEAPLYFSPGHYSSLLHHITWDMILCSGSTILSRAAPTEGIWSTDNPTIASVSSDGHIFGVSAGTTAISIAISNSCNTVYDYGTLTVVSSPTTIIGASSICTGTSTTLSNATAGGTWSSSNTAKATVDAGGVVTGIDAGEVNITYSTSCGNAVFAMTVLSAPSTTISGITTLCAGSATTLTNATPGGSWSSGDMTVATVTSGGMWYGVTPGTTNINYSNGCGAAATITVTTINHPPIPGITGTLSVCQGSNTTLSASAGGGTWSSATTSVATVNASGVVRGVAAGNSTISYAESNSCGTSYGTAVITVNPLPFAGTISPSSTISLCSFDNFTPTSSGTSGGTWSLSTSSVATINAVTGYISTIAISSAATLTAIYTVTNSCGTTLTSRAVRLRRNPTFTYTPSGSGPHICNGESVTVTTTPSGGSYAWGGPNIIVTTISSNIANVAAISTGTSNTLSYTYSGDAVYCATTIPIYTYTVDAKPTYTITGTSILSTGSGTCAPNSATLSILTTPSGAGTHQTPSWTWTPTSPTTYATMTYTNGTVSATSNTVTAVASGGSEVITYSAYGSYCYLPNTATYTVTVNPCKEGPNSIEEENIKCLQIYPNPTFGSFTIELPDASTSAITITDLSGRIIATRISHRQHEDFDLGSYPRGIYFIAVDTENKKYRHKVLLE